MTTEDIRPGQILRFVICYCCESPFQSDPRFRPPKEPQTLYFQTDYFVGLPLQ